MAKKNKDVEVKQDVAQAAEQPISSVNRYFTKEVRAQMTEMSTKEMENVLKELIDTRQFIAMIKYSNMRTMYLDMALRTTNPTTDPHTISYHQGAFAGICDLESYVIELNAPKPPSEEQEEGESAGGNPSGVIIG